MYFAIRALNLLKNMINIIKKLLNFLIYLSGKNDLLYIKMSCYI